MQPSEIQKIIENIEIFKGLENKDYELIISLGEIISLGADEILFRQGDPSDSLYVVLSGKLSAEVITKTGETVPVGIITKGETIGELGVISNKLRAATISTLTDSILFSVSEINVKKIAQLYPQMLITLISFIVTRSQNLINIIKEPVKNESINTGMIFLEDIPILKTFIEELKNSIPEKLGILDARKLNFNLSTPNSEILEFMENYTKKYKNNLLLLDIENTQLLEVISKKIEQLYLVYSNESTNILHSKIYQILIDSKNKLGKKIHLVRIHDKDIILKIKNKHFYDLPFVTRHHQIRIGTKTDYDRLIRYILGTQTGLVLGGGGVKGWAHFGILKALEELHVPIDMIGGTSSGAVAAACYAVSENYTQALESFTKIMSTLRKPFKFSNLTYPKISIYSGKVGTVAIQNVFKNTLIEDLLLPFFCISTNLSNHDETIHLSGPIWEALRASVSIPGLLPPMVINNYIHTDGGLINNLPVDRMRMLLGVESKIIAVTVGRKQYYPDYNFPPILTIFNIIKYKLGILKYQFPSYPDFFLNSLLIGSITKELGSCEHADLLIAPDIADFKMIGIKESEEKKLIEIGYQTAIKALQNNKII